MEKAGMLWQTGGVYPAQEHFISQLIRQKLILAIDSQNEQRQNNKTFLLFLPENEYHELGLLYLNFLIRKQGHTVVYLGQNVPLINLKNVLSIHKIDFFLTSIASNLPDESVLEILQELNILYGDKQILIGGHCFLGNTISLPTNFTLFKNMPDFFQFLNTL
jgi:methanogenic corrinoid protein MtbC1